ncbi:MAG: fibronectin type III domain-containing protein [bacterium]|nr:fibronectin type III domain-containing protein [bacterium]
MKKKRTIFNTLSRIFTVFAVALFFGFSGVTSFFEINNAHAATPTLVAAGAKASAITAVTPPLPAGLAVDDILLLFVETANQAITIPTPNGGVWAQVTNSPQGTGTAGIAGATRLTVFWSRYNGTQGAPTTSDSGDHQFAQIIAFRGVIATGNPWDVTAGDILATASTAVTIPGVTTTSTETLVVAVVANDTDVNNTPQTSGWANGGLSSLTEVLNADANTNAGRGGGFGVAVGPRLTTGATGNSTATLLNSSIQARMTIALKPPLTLAIGATSGNKVASLNSGSTAQYANDVTCNSPASCSAFTLVSSAGETLTSTKITETGTTNATNNLSNLAVFYDTDGNFANGVTGQYGTTVASLTSEAATVSGSLALVAGTTYYFYVRADMINGASDPKGGETINFQIALPADVVTSALSAKSGAPVSLAGTTTVKPKITSYTNSTEPALDYSNCAGTGCGARIGGGVGFKQSVVITGFGFGVRTCGTGNCSTISDNIKIGTHQITDANVITWSSTSITFQTDTLNVGDTDTDWGSEFGGVGALAVTAGGAASGGLDFYIFPQVISLTMCNKAEFPVGDGGREHDGTDSVCLNGLKDGQVRLNGTRFGTAVTGGYVRILGCDVTTCASPTGTVNVDSWGNELIQVQVPPVIDDTINTGSLIMKQGLGSNNKMHSYTMTNFRVFPRIISPPSASVGDPITITGNHLCQGGTCPLAFGIIDNVIVFNSYATSTVWGIGGWTDTAVNTQVPTSAMSGNVVITSNIYKSNAVIFSLLSLVPDNPLNLTQRDASLATISIGGTASSTPVRYTLDTSSAITGGTMYSQVEVRPVLGTNRNFTSTCSANSYCFEGTGTAYGGGTINLLTTSTPPGDIYHWQARVRYNKSGSDYYSSWVSFDSASPETSTDFQIDTTAPPVTNISSGLPGSNSATITWDTTDEVSTSRIEYNIGGMFAGGYNCAGTTECTALTDVLPTRVNLHSIALSNLNSGTTYSYRVRSMDAAGNETVSGISTFLTATVNNPAKTTKFYVAGGTSPVTNASPGIYQFYATTTEANITAKSSFITLTGIYETTNVSPTNSSVTVQYESESPVTYVLPGGPSGTFRNYFKIIRKVNTVNTVTQNTFTVRPDAATTLYVNSASLVMTYSYTP